LQSLPKSASSLFDRLMLLRDVAVSSNLSERIIGTAPRKLGPFGH
jgi:hypothetical protein